MSTIEITKRMAEGSPRSRNRFVLAYYMLSILTGAFFFFFHGELGSAVDVSAALLYLAATALLYTFSRRGSDQGREKGRL